MARAFLSICLLISALSLNTKCQTAKAGQIDKGKLFGGIEIGSEGIKAAAIRVSDAGQGYDLEVVFTESSFMALVQNNNGMFRTEAVKATAQEVWKLDTKMQQQFKVPTEQIYIIGTSDLRAYNLEELIKEVRDMTGKTMTFLELEADVRLTIVGTIPRRYREGTTWFDNRSLSVLIDVSADNTKSGYQQVRQPVIGNPYYDYVVLSVPKGTVNFTNEVNQQVQENDDLKKFALTAKKLSEDSLRTSLRNEIESRPGLANRKKVYLSGGIVWALATLLHPEDRRPFVPITVNDINTFYNRAVNNPQALLQPDLSQIRDAGLRKDVETDLKTVRSIFSAKSLVAGAEILRTLASECNFQGEGKRILFARFSNLSLILSYVRSRAENEPQP